MDSWKRAQGMSGYSIEEGSELGRIDDFQFDLQTRQIYGWRLRQLGVFGKVGGLKSEDMILLGEDVALISSKTAVSWGREKKSSTHGRFWASRYRKTEVLNRRGESLGRIVDIVIDQAGNEVQGFLLTGEQLLPLFSDVVIGPDSVIVEKDGLLEQLSSDDSGEETTWTRVRDFFSKSKQT